MNKTHARDEITQAAQHLIFATEDADRRLWIVRELRRIVELLLNILTKL